MFDNLSVYIFKQILVTFADGNKKEGILVSYDSYSILLNEDATDFEYRLENICDIEYVGRITDYHTYDGYGELDEYRFEPKQILTQADRDHILYNEYDCVAACHLGVSAGDTNKTCAHDVRLLSWNHILHMETLRRGRYIYCYQDGTALTGELTVKDGLKYLVLGQDKIIDFVSDGIEKIMPLPGTDESICIVKKDGTDVCGIYNGMFRNCIAVRKDQGFESIAITDIAALRFVGTVAQSSSGYSRNLMICRKNDASGINYIFKTPYLRNDDDIRMLQPGSEVEFEPSMTARYPIAKDVVVVKAADNGKVPEDEEEAVEPIGNTTVQEPEAVSPENEQTEVYAGRGILLFFKTGEPVAGYIGETYYVYPYNEIVLGSRERPRGYVRYQAELIEFKVNPLQVYVVDYTCAQKPSPDAIQNALSVTLVESYSKQDYASIRIDENGKIHAEPAATAYLALASQSAVNRNANLEVGILCKNGETYHGYVFDYTETELTLQHNEANISIAVDQIKEVRYFSLITWNDAMQIRTSSPSPLVIHINDMAGDDDRARFGAELRGAMISYQIRHNYHWGQQSRGLMGVDGKLYQTRQFDGYLSAYDDDTCVIVEKDDLYSVRNRIVCRKPMLRPSAALDLQQMKLDFRKYDYPVKCSLRSRKDDVQLLINAVADFGKLQKTQQYGYLTSRDGGMCMIQPENEEMHYVYPVIYESATIRNAQLDCTDADWRVSYVLGSSSGVEGVLLLDINVFDKRPKKTQQGYLVDYNGDLCRIAAEEEYGRSAHNEQSSKLILMRSEGLSTRLEHLDIDRMDYEVRYVNCVRFGREGVALINVGTGHLKVKFGYVVVAFMSHPQFKRGYITVPEQLAEKLRRPFASLSSDLCFFPGAVRGIKPTDIRTPDIYYEVAYLQDASGKVSVVRFLRAIPRTIETVVQPAAEQSPLPVQSAVLEPQPVVIQPREETISIRSLTESNDSLYEGKEVRFGMINLASTQYAWIHPGYFNKRLNTDVKPPERAVLALFDPSKTTFLGLKESRLKTAKRTYVVRYVQKDTMVNAVTGEDHPSVDYDYPVEILTTIDKNHCIRVDLETEEDRLIITWNAASQLAALDSRRKPEDSSADEANYDVPALSEGENILVEMADKKKFVGTLVSESEEDYIFKEVGAVPKNEVSRIYRFGLITDYQDGVSATMNGATDFSFNALESAVSNIMKMSAFVQLHVIYTCEENRITAVRRMTEEELKLIGLTAGRVTEYSSTARQLIVDNETIHCISVQTNPDVRSECREGRIVDREVFVRPIRHLFMDEGAEKAELMQFALDVCCADMEMTVRYDTGLGIYKAESDNGVFLPISAPVAAVKPLEGKRVLMDIIPNSIGNEMLAYLHGQSFGEEISDVEEEVISVDIKDLTLSKLILNREALKRSQLLPHNKTDHDGMPLNQEAASDALRTFNGRPANEDTLIAGYLIAERFPEAKLPADGSGRVSNRDFWMKKQLRTLYERKCDQISRTENYSCAEYSNYLSVLLSIAPKATRAIGRARTRLAYTQEDCLYKLFGMDFTRPANSGKSPDSQKNVLEDLFAQGKACCNMRNFTAHLLMIDRKHIANLSKQLQRYPELIEGLTEYARGIDSTLQADTVGTLIQSLSSKYEQLRRRFIENVEEIPEGTFSLLPGYLAELSKCFLKLICEEDARNFDTLHELTNKLISYRSKAGFAAQENELLEVYRRLDELEKEILRHPGRESLELLATPLGEMESLLVRIRKEAARLLNEMYGTAGARIRLEPISQELPCGQKFMRFTLSNGDEDSSYCQTVTNLTLTVKSLTEGVAATVLNAPMLLAGGESEEVNVELKIAPEFTGEILLEWFARYRCGIEFKDGKTVYDWMETTDVADPFQLADGNLEKKNTKVENPYRKPAEGQPLEVEDRKMFFGREEEKKKILNAILRDVDGCQRFYPGSTILLYGQRKCGKTSLTGKICDEIRKDKNLSGQAIILTFSDILTNLGGPKILPEFRMAQYRHTLIRFDREVHNNHKDVEELLRKNNLTVPSKSNLSRMSYAELQMFFEDFFQRFSQLDQGRHVVVLIMDEFTRLCTTIVDLISAYPNDAQIQLYADIPSFIRMFSREFGFVQFIIGHESMMRAFGKLGTLNHTAEFATKIELHALKSAEAEELIRKPMQDVFEYDVYRSSLGRKAVELLKDLSGCSPTFLMRLCRDVFDYYVEQCPDTQLTESDIRKVVAQKRDSLTEDDFDILVTEDGDGTGMTKNRDTYKFLFAAARCALYPHNSRTADEKDIRNALQVSDEKYEEVRNLLLRRHVISLTGLGQLKINNGLFLEYVRKMIN